MVKKLFKHEINAYLRIMLPVYICLMGVAILGRFIQIFEADTTIYSVINGSSIFAYVVAVLICFGFSTFFSITRFYKNLFTGEGYLTFTLPATPTQHLWVKLLTSMLFGFASFIVVLISLMAITAGDAFDEGVKALIYIAKIYIPKIGFHIWLYLLEAVILLILTASFGYLLYYTCISIGQLSKKNRVLCAVGVYIGYYFITQILGTIFMVVITFLASTPFMKAIAQFAVNHTYAFIHIILCILIVLTAVMALVCFAITRHIMTKKLNLE